MWISVGIHVGFTLGIGDTFAWEEMVDSTNINNLMIVDISVMDDQGRNLLPIQLIFSFGVRFVPQILKKYIALFQFTATFQNIIDDTISVETV